MSHGRATASKPAAAPRPTLKREKALVAPVCGVDEAGRGPLAGPVVAAAVILHGRVPRGIHDSKQLTRAEREAVFRKLTACALIGIGQAEVAEIDEINILHASMLAMRRAVLALPVAPAHALVDGNRAPLLPCPCDTVIGGDALCLSIAAASIVAKVTRDRLMTALAAEHPGYGWERNAGYGTPEHLEAIGRQGITRHHRLSFAPVRQGAAASLDILAKIQETG